MRRYVALGEWHPDGADWTSMRDLKPGMLIAYDHAVWVLEEIRMKPADLAKDGRDRNIVVRRHGSSSGKPLHLAGGEWSRIYTYPDEHYPVCRTCQEPTPCRHLIREATIEAENERYRRYEIANVCPACQEPITARQLCQTWPENLYVPLGPPVRFHLRHKCVRTATEYDRAWIKAGHQSRLGYSESSIEAVPE